MQRMTAMSAAFFSSFSLADEGLEEEDGEETSMARSRCLLVFESIGYVVLNRDEYT